MAAPEQEITTLKKEIKQLQNVVSMLSQQIKALDKQVRLIKHVNHQQALNIDTINKKF